MSSTIQSILFQKSQYTPKQAREWLKKHKFVPLKQKDTTKNFHRYRLREPDPTKVYFTKKTSKGLSLVFQRRAT